MAHFLEGLDKNKEFNLKEAFEVVDTLRKQVKKASDDLDSDLPGIIGLDPLINRLISSLISAEHLLIEGVPGLGKTFICKTFAKLLNQDFKRVQFTPDMMPSDLISQNTLDIEGDKTKVTWRRGPIFTNIFLADEINRSSPKVQSATLEATEEGYVTPMNKSRMIIRPKEPLDEDELMRNYGPYFGVKEKFKPRDARGQNFIMMATQNPIEQEGVYPLSEAQLDRFSYKHIVPSPITKDVSEIGRHTFFIQKQNNNNNQKANEESHVKTLYFFSTLRSLLLGENAMKAWYDGENSELRERVENLVAFTHSGPLGRGDEEEDDEWSGARTEKSIKRIECEILLKKWQASENENERRSADMLIRRLSHPDFPVIESGASPRGYMKLIKAIHCEAFLNGRFSQSGEVVKPTWEDVSNIAYDVLRHRIRLTIGAVALGAKPEQIIRRLLECL